jgi:hypothetical protein
MPAAATAPSTGQQRRARHGGQKKSGMGEIFSCMGGQLALSPIPTRREKKPDEAAQG